MENSLQIKLKYDGDALRSGVMDGRNLAPALLAITDLFEEANSSINPDNPKLVVRVRSEFQRGSFEITLEIVQGIIEQAIKLFNSDSINSLLNLVEVLGLGTGLFALLKKLKGKKPKSIIVIDEKTVIIKTQAGEEFEILKAAVDLYANPKIRKAVKDSLGPLKEKGIDQFELDLGKNDKVGISKDELAHYEMPDDEEFSEIINETEKTQAFTIVSLAFKDDNKWRLSDGANTFFVTIHDYKFLEEVNANRIQFAKDDILKVKLKQIQWHTVSGLKTEYEVEQVLQHIKAQPQLKLPFEERKDDNQ